MNYIQGDDRNQVKMFPPILDDYVAENNPVRVIDAFADSLDLAGLGFAKSIMAETGRPPYSPCTLRVYI